MHITLFRSIGWLALLFFPGVSPGTVSIRGKAPYNPKGRCPDSDLVEERGAQVVGFRLYPGGAGLSGVSSRP